MVSDTGDRSVVVEHAQRGMGLSLDREVPDNFITSSDCHAQSLVAERLVFTSSVIAACTS